MKLSTDQVKDVQQRFVRLHGERLKRTQELMRGKQAEFLDVLPLLFQINHSKLPGFAGMETPCGIANFAVENRHFELARKLFGKLDSEQTIQRQNRLDALFIMGSCGTLAFSKNSDFDIWLCHADDLNDNELRKLQQKATGIEEWAAAQGLEVHFFLMNADRFRQGMVNELSSESSGTAQHLLLLDEFYRTSVWLAGKQPVWWFVPPEHDHEYEQCKQYILDNQFIHRDEVIDFGGIEKIPAEEFFGASVWQIYKGIDSPYKSILKITLMEAYAHEDVQLLSQKYKQDIYAQEDGKLDLNQLDPYTMLYRYLEDYLLQRNEILRLELIKRAFYIKLQLPLSINVRKETWRHVRARELINSWNWNDTDIAMLDARDDWGVFEVMDERKLLVEHLTKSYLFLSQFARDQSKKSNINEKDLTILGRKLYAAFERKPGKIDIFNRGIKNDISEDTATFILGFNKKKQPQWLMFRGKLTPDQVKNHIPAKQTQSLIELLAWCYANQVVTNNTQKLVYAHTTGLTSNDIRTMLEPIHEMIPDPAKLKAESRHFLKPAYVTHGFVFINADTPPGVAFSGNVKTVISGAIDVLQFSHKGESLFNHVEFLYINNWGEVFVERYDGINGFFEWLTACCQWQQDTHKRTGETFDVGFYCQTPHIGQRVANRAEEIYQQMVSAFFKPGPPKQRFIADSIKSTFCISNESDAFTLQSFSDKSELISFLRHNHTSFIGSPLDTASLTQHPLRAILPNNKEGVIQLYFLNLKQGSTVFIMDDVGALNILQYPANSMSHILPHLYRFCRHYITMKNYAEFSIEKRNYEYSLKEGQLLEIHRMHHQKLEFHSQQQDLQNFSTLQDKDLLNARGFLNKNRKVFSFNCNGQTYSSAEHGNNVFALAAQKCCTPTQPVVLSTLELESSLAGLAEDQNPSFNLHLKYKKVLEDKLQQFLAAQGSS